MWDSVNLGAELFKAGLRWPRVSAKFEFIFESLKSISVLILFVYKLMTGSSKNNRENYPRKCFWTQEKETRVKFNPGLSANRPSNNWAKGSADNTYLDLDYSGYHKNLIQYLFVSFH